MRARGKIIALEGIDMAGKTATVHNAVTELRRAGYAVQAADELNSDIGRVIRGFLRGDATTTTETLALLFSAARLDALHRAEALLCEGVSLVFDRFLWSSLVYQGARGEDTWVQQVNMRTPRADLNIVLDLDPRIAAARNDARPDIWDGDLEFQERVRDGYLRLVQQHPTTARLIDASRDPAMVLADVVREIQQVLDE